nr:hypothetical protein [Halovulum marinum]
MNLFALALASVTALGTVAAPLPAQADAPKIKVESKHDKYKYEYKDGRCEFKYEMKYGKNEVKQKSKGDCSHVARFPRFAPPSAQVVAAPRAVVPAPRPAVRRRDCNSDALGALIGAGIGAAAGTRVGDGDTVTVVAGTVLGGLLGREIGAKIDDRDRRCIGSALEYAEPGRAFEFANPQTGLGYFLRPLERGTRAGSPCRGFEARFGDGPLQRGTACREAGGWNIVELR